MRSRRKVGVRSRGKMIERTRKVTDRRRMVKKMSKRKVGKGARGR